MTRCSAMLLPIAMLIVANGCTPAANISNMVPKSEAIYQQSARSLAVGDVQGGVESNMWDGPRIYRTEFKAALELALEEAELFRPRAEDETSDYILNAYIKHQNQPSMGMNMTSDLVVDYTLIDSQTGDTAWKKEIASQYTASCTSSFVGTNRLAKANEGAVRENIQQLLAELSNLGL